MNTLCGIDFGTSNSTISVFQQGKAQLLPIEDKYFTIPSALFFNFDENQVSFGRHAIDDYIEGEFGRFMRSLKSILGTSLMNQGTHIKQRQVSYSEIIGQFIGEIKQRAEQQLGSGLLQVVAGRPVHFVDGDKQADEMAQNALEAIYRQIGFQEVEFQFEPIAAAMDYEQQLDHEELALIVDIGGGTSDFTLIRLSPGNQAKADRYEDILATSGIHIGGNDFDRRFNLAQAMPALGMGSHMQGSSRLELPNGPYFDLATWHLIHNQYERSNIHHLESLKLQVEQPKLIERLLTVLKNQDGHRLIGKVEDAKIQLASELSTELDLDFIEPTLQLDVSRKEFEEATLNEVAGITRTIQESLQLAQLQPSQINSVFLTGGTTGLPCVQQAVKATLPECKLVAGDRFGSVGVGLTVDAVKRFR